MTSGLPISVIIPAYNRADMIGVCIASVRGRHDGPFELIVVDDGSTDGTAEAAEAAIAACGLGDRGRVLRQTNSGPGAARNAGAATARGDWLAFLDSDDRWFDWTLDRLALAFAAAPGPTLFFLQNIDCHNPVELDAVAEAAPEAETFARFTEAVDASIACRRPIRFGAYAMPRDAFARLGGFTTDVRCSEDLDLFLRGEGGWSCTLLRSPAMMGYRTGAGDNLSGNPACLRDGLALMIRNETAGRYPPGPYADPLRARLLAGSAVFAARTAFARGQPGLAYGLLSAHAAAIARHRGPRSLAIAALTPLLHLIRPRSFPFRLRPEAAR